MCLNDTRGSKVDDCDFRVCGLFVEKKILWFEIAMDDLATVAVGNCREYLLNDVGGIALTKELLLRDSFKQFPTIAKPK